MVPPPDDLTARSRRRRTKPKPTTNCFGAMNAEPHRYALRCLQARQPGQPGFRSFS